MLETIGRRGHWEGIYGKKKVDEVSWFQPRPSTSLDLVWRTGLGTRASIVDVGGGASRLVDLLLSEGFSSVAVLDIAEAALQRSKERLGALAAQVTWITADVTLWMPERRFDVWHDRACFHFLGDERDRRHYRKALDAALAPGGQAIIGTFALDGPERCSNLPVVRYDAPSLLRELGPGYRLAETLNEDHRTPSGGVQRFQFCRFVRL
jgi:SAM-dependent methyltransferase